MGGNDGKFRFDPVGALLFFLGKVHDLVVLLLLRRLPGSPAVVGSPRVNVSPPQLLCPTARPGLLASLAHTFEFTFVRPLRTSFEGGRFESV